MDPESYARISEIFQHAIELPAHEVSGYLESVCQGNNELRAEVESLLRERTRTCQWLDSPLPKPGVLEPESFEPLVGTRIGPYEVVARLAEGGMGTVFEAQQESPSRRVALKVMHGSMVSASAAARFRYEAQALARLTHPGIAQIYEAGTHRGPTGTLAYYAMELIPGGRSILAHARTLSRRDRLDLFLLLCDAVAHAHRRGVIHRDLKPSNVLVTPEGHVKVLDFGIAKLVEHQEGDTTLLTLTGQMLGTPGYMSPEQARGDPGSVDVRSDVFSLGVILYEMLTDHQPFEADGASPFELARAVAEGEPIPARTFDRSLCGDLENILAHALEKSRELRYQSVDALAQDIRAYLSNRPVAARAPTSLYMFRKFAARNRALIAGAAGVALALMVGLGIAAWQAVVATSARERSEHDFAVSRLREYTAQVQAAAAALDLDDTPAARLHLESTSPDLRGWEWKYLQSQLDHSSSVFPMPEGITAEVTGIAVSPDGHRVLACYSDRALVLHELPSGSIVAQVIESEQSEAPAFARPVFSPDGRHVLLSRQYGPWFEIRDADTLALERVITGFEFETLGGAWSPDGRQIALCGGHVRPSEKAPARLMVIDASTGEKLRDDVISTSSRFDNPVFLATGENLLCTLGSSPARVDLHSGTLTRLPIGEPGPVGARLFSSPNGLHFALVFQSRIHVFDLSSQRPIAMLGLRTKEANCFSPDSSSLYTSSAYSIDRWDVASGGKTRSWRCDARINALAVTPDGRQLLVGGNTGAIHVFDTNIPGAQFLSIPSRDNAAPSPDFSRLAYSFPGPGNNEDDRVFFRDTQNGELLGSAVLGASWPPAGNFAWSPEQHWLVRFEPHHGVAILRLADQSEHHVENERGWDRGVFLPGGDRLLAIRNDGLDVLTIPALELEREIPLECKGINGDHLVPMFAEGLIAVRHRVPEQSGTVTVLEWPGAREVSRWQSEDLSHLGFSASRNLVAVPARSGLGNAEAAWEIRLYELLTGRLASRSPSLPAEPRALLFDAERGRIYVGLFDSSVVVLGITQLPHDRDPTIFEILTLHTGTSWIERLHQSEDGTRLMATTVYPSNRALIWDSRPVSERGSKH